MKHTKEKKKGKCCLYDREKKAVNRKCTRENPDVYLTKTFSQLLQIDSKLNVLQIYLKLNKQYK